MKKYSTKDWEDICRRCGKCCLIKLQDDETEEIYYTNVVCKYFDEETIEIIANAVEDHSSNLTYEPRNIYGKINI